MDTGIKNKAYFALTATSIIWGTTWVASRIGVEDVPGLQVSYLRQFIAGCLLLVFFFARGEKLPTWQQFRWLFILSIFMFVLANGFSTWSVKYIPSGLASLISALAPICVVLIDLVFFKQFKNTPLTFIGLFIGFAGVAIVFYENAFHEQPEGYALGIIYGFIAMIGWSIGTIFITRNKYNINPYYAMGWQMFLSSFMIFALAKITNQNIPINEVSLKTWGAIAYLIIMGSIFAFAAFIYSIKYLPTAIASLYAYINPIVAMLFGTLILDEPLTINLLLGAIVTLVGVYIVNYSVKKT
ncbi:EamA family transporter [Panacibacter ginsenosidivorans]|uniref:EamA family transporter n=1 Tax=Panacibacter ginsenosidivorans TaxID=1813871 RepID=A0A5B8V6Y9_9BACT|nr:EamA family transporter [Panacibacter ginsenosidivorans]QEC67072.1 EamA family transporter [Panacibacter ginsenosidivorans]